MLVVFFQKETKKYLCLSIEIHSRGLRKFLYPFLFETLNKSEIVVVLHYMFAKYGQLMIYINSIEFVRVPKHLPPKVQCVNRVEKAQSS